MKKFLFSLGVFSLLLPTIVSAATFLHDRNLNVDQPIQGNVYAAGSKNVMVPGNVEGDLFSAGGTVFLTGSVAKDAAVAGGTVNITGSIGEDLRVLGVNIYLDGTVQGEVIAAGSDIKVGPHAVIQGNFYSSSGTITIDPQAKIVGERHIVKDEGEKEKAEKIVKKMAIGAMVFAEILSILSLLLVGAILFGAFKKPVQLFVEEARSKEHFWSHLGYGFLVLFVTPFLVILSWVTGIGLMLGFILLFAYLLYILFGIVFSGILLGGLLALWMGKDEKKPLSWLTLILGIVLLHFVSMVPVVGWIVSFGFLVVSIGSLLCLKGSFLKKM